MRNLDRHWILDDKKNAIPVGLYEWARWFGTNDRQVKLTVTELHRISTVFVGLDMSFMSDGPPLLFETMVFGDAGDDHDQARWATWNEAVAGHDKMVKDWAEREASAAMFVLKPKKEKAGK